MSTHVRQLFDLEGKTALVTGGSRGLGLQIAEALGEAGARVLLTSRKAQDLEESAAQIATSSQIQATTTWPNACRYGVALASASSATPVAHAARVATTR